MSFILGLDVSTACTGWSILDSRGQLVDMGAIVLSKAKTLYKKAENVREVMQGLSLKYDINAIFIEENLQSFRRGFSSAKTLSTLARFNGVVSMVAYDAFNLEPFHINVNFARKSLGIKLIRKSNGGAPTKEQVQSWVDKQLSLDGGTFEWPIKIFKSGPRKDMRCIDPIAYDMADAYVIARAGIVSGNLAG
tara:strand:+ start:790 stop:1365 length:576 start_codon:yes stop_codon:yes gene_type:complete